MLKFVRAAVAVTGLAILAPTLSACHTTAGVGQDLSQGGTALKNAANANAPSTPSQ